MAKKKKNQSTQKIVKIVEASNLSPPYEVASNKSNTNDTISKTKRNENIDSHLCKCDNKSKSTNQRPKTWESITKMYGDADTTEVWDGKGKNPERFFRRKMEYKEKRKLKQQPERNNDDRNDTITPKSKHPKKHKSAIKRSIISFYHKQNKRKRGFRSKDPKLQENKRKNDYNVEDVNVEPPTIRFKVNRKPYKSFNQHNGTGDSCIGGPCTRDLKNYKQQKQYNTAVLEDKTNISSNKNETKKMKAKGQIPEKKIEKRYITSKSSSEKVKDLLSKCSFLNFFCKHSSQKSHNIVDKSNGEPMFEMKVDSVDMRVLNTSEINDNVKKFGKRERNNSCICPSRTKYLKKGKHNVCAKGICERALTNNRTRFDCKCKGKNNLFVCKDSTCNSKDFKYYKKRKKCKLFKSSKCKHDLNKPPLEVVLDRTNMNILNSYEIENTFRRASNYQICPTGICNDAAKDTGTKLKCKCIGKKIIPVTKECTDETCARTMKNCNLTDICSRFFCKSDYRLEADRKKIHEYKKRPVIKKKHRKQDIERQNIKANSDTNNKRIVSIAPQLTRQGEGWYETFCECNIKRTKLIKEKFKKEKRKPTKKKKEDQKGNQVRKILKSSKNIIRRENNFKQYIIKCLRRKRVRCEKKLKEKEKEFKNREKKTTKENLKMQKILEKNNKIEEPHWNCLTKFISGILNLGINLIKEIFTMTFSLLTNPIGSYVYIRERAKDPPGTIKKMIDWFCRIWSNKTTKVSQTVKESDTMNVIADQIEDSAIYDALFANKGKTKAEKSLYERKKRMRKKRIMKRHDEALFGCRHMLLTTMRKTPCLWFYHICPDLYPQCLSLVSFMTNFFHIIIYLVAFICWTPCIVSFELCRAFLCCFFCTG